MSWCHQWHRHASRGCRWSDEMTFCSPFPPTAVATSRQERGKETETHRERWVEHSEKEWEMMRRERSDDRLLTCTFASAYYFYPVPSNCCCYIPSLLPLSSPPSISALIFLPISLQKPTQAALRQQAQPRYVEEGLLFLMRYPLWDFKHPPRPLPPATPAQSGGQGKVRVRRGRMEGLRGRDRRDEAWERKRDT